MKCSDGSVQFPELRRRSTVLPSWLKRPRAVQKIATLLALLHFCAQAFAGGLTFTERDQTMTNATCGSVTPLRTCGLAVLPTPQQVRLMPGRAVIEQTWQIVTENLTADDIAPGWLRESLKADFGLDLTGGGESPGTILLAVDPDAVKTGLDAGRNKQAYRLTVSQQRIEIVGNSPQGLFYGVQTLLQMIRRDGAGRLVVPACEIRDWPQYELRILHWDTKHHQDRIETLKRYLDWSARFKVNAIVFELEDKFEYPSHPVIGAPGAFTTEQLQDLVNYALQRYIQIIPDIQAPAHMCYVLKHPEFAHLRCDGNNYLACLSKPETYKLIFDMYQDVINATKGVEYFFVSTDEVYYAGICPDCQKVRPYNPVNRSLWWVEFVKKAHEFLSARGRRMMLWVEYPLLPEHVHLLPPDVIDGIIGKEEYIETENRMGIRQLAYVPIQGAEKLFPNYFDWTDKRGRFHRGRLKDAYEGPLRGKATRGNPIGTFAAAWDDAGLHNETFGLGWATMAAYGWHPGGAPLDETAVEFMEIYYGPNIDAAEMLEAYRLLQRGARFWEEAWDRVTSRERPPAYGNSRGKGIGTRRVDLTLRTPQLPSLPDLKVEATFKLRYKKLLEQARHQEELNERLRILLQSNISKATRNRYNIEVLYSLADFQRHFIELLLGLQEVEDSLLKASALHRRGLHDAAITNLVHAHKIVSLLVEDLDQTYAKLKATFEKSRYPKGRSVGGRKFLHIMDDVKDHFADRRPDLSFMIAPEQSLKLPEWRDKLAQIIRDYAKAHNVTPKDLPEPVLED